MKDEMLSIREAAVIARCSYGKMFRLVHAGEFKSFRKIGNVWLAPKSQYFEELGLRFDQEERDDALCA